MPPAKTLPVNVTALTSSESISTPNRVDRSVVMKKPSTRHVSEIMAIASKFGNSA